MIATGLATGFAMAPALEAPVTAGGQALADAMHLAPMMIVGLWSLLLIAADAFSGPGLRVFQRRLALLGLAFAAVATASQMGDTEVYDEGVRVFSSFLVVDQFALLLDFALVGIMAAVIAFGGDFARSHRFEYGEHEALVLIAGFGAMMLGHASNLLAIFLGIETMSIAVYVLVGARWNSRRSPEAALKYFVLGAFASGLLVMGMALVYGATGTLALRELGVRTSALLSGGVGSWQSIVPDLREVYDPANAATFDAARDRAVVAFAPIALLIPGLLLMMAALLFKVSAVPLHMWTPDAYDGAPTPTTAFMAAAVKIGGFAAILKIFVGALPVARLVHAPYGWATVVGVIALLTMTVGNLAAVRQTNLKRLFAYSSIAHVGYLLVGVVAAAIFYSDKATSQFKHVSQAEWSEGNGDLAVAGVLLYLITYSVATLGVFACLSFHGANKREGTGIHEWEGLAQRHPGMALGMTICLLSLMGMPPLAGFFAKVSVFKVALTSGNGFLRVLVIVALVNAVIGASYYLRIIVAMYFRPPPEQSLPVLPGRAAPAIVAIAATMNIASGIGAGTLIERCRVAAAGFNYSAGGGLRGEKVQKLREAYEAESETAPDTSEGSEEGFEEGAEDGANGGADGSAEASNGADGVPADAVDGEAVKPGGGAIPTPAAAP